MRDSLSARLSLASWQILSPYEPERMVLSSVPPAIPGALAKKQYESRRRAAESDTIHFNETKPPNLTRSLFCHDGSFEDATPLSSLSSSSVPSCYQTNA